jgi:RecA-family ATPase
MTTKAKSIEDIAVSSLMEMEFPEPKWMIPSIIPEGLSILCGKPKIGKSILSVNLAVAAATGGMALGKLQVEKSGVLYLALEDSQRRLKMRFRKALTNSKLPENLFVSTTFASIKDGGLGELETWLDEHKDVGFVIIDTLARIKDSGNGSRDPYQNDYGEMVKIKKVADNCNVGILLIHHTRKAESEDVYDTVLGTTGITGAADTVIVLTKANNMITLNVRGRDVEEAELALEFDTITMGFTLIGDAREYSLTDERKEIVTLLRGNGGAMKLKDIADAIGKKADNTRHLLKKLVDDGFVRQPKAGVYAINDKPL